MPTMNDAVRVMFGFEPPPNFWDLPEEEREEVFISHVDYTSLHWCYRSIQGDLMEFLSARDTLQLHGEYPDVATCRTTGGLVGGLYLNRPDASTRPKWFGKVEATHDLALRLIKRKSTNCVRMLVKLSRHVVARTVRVSVVTGVLTVANFVVPWVVGSEAVTFGGLNFLNFVWGLSTAVAAMTWLSLALVRRCLHRAERLRSMVKEHSFAVTHEEVGRWGGWDWVWIDEVVLPEMVW